MFFSTITAAFLLASTPVTAPIPLTDFAKPSEVSSIELSPDGKTIAVLAPFGPKGSIVLFMDAETLKPTQGLKDEGEFSIGELYWLSNTRVAAATVQKFGGYAKPLRTGELLGVNSDGTGSTILYGSRGSMQAGTNIKNKAGDDGFAEIVDPNFDDEKHAFIAVSDFNSEGGFTELRRMNKKNGSHSRIATAPIRRGQFLISKKGEPLVSFGQDVEGKSKVYLRDGKEWTLLIAQTKPGAGTYPIALADGDACILAYRSQSNGPSILISIEMASGKETTLFTPKTASPLATVMSADQRELIAIITADDHFGIYYVKPDAPEAKIMRGMAKNFPEQFVWPISMSQDRTRIVFLVSSGSNSGEYYVYDSNTKAAKFLFPRDSWLDPKQMASVTPFKMAARDGLALHGYLTTPAGVVAKNLPLVVMPHGGPHGVRDYPEYDGLAQMLASRGYAILKINYRGSGGYGDAFERKGYRQWGRKMQDDVTDATRWAIAEGIADPARIAIAGASYGGYAALMGAVREPDLYKAVISYVGVSDLELMYSRGDIEDSKAGNNYLERVLGADKAELRANSPVHYAANFTAPVLIIHGEADNRVPVQHGRKMRDALKSAGKIVEYVEASGEGHGFYKPENVLMSYEKMLSFLDVHLKKAQ